MSRVIVLAVVAVALCLGGAPRATAADVAVIKAPIARAVPFASGWAGPYAGVALGATWTDAKWTTTQLIEPPSPDVGAATIDSSSPDRFTPSSFRVGGYAGYNWQAGPWVYGIEIDAAWSDGADTRAGIPGCKIICNPGFPGPGATSSAIRVLWDAGLRARAGYLVMSDMLIYATGGITWQAIEVSGTCSNTLSDPVCLVSPPFAVKTQTDRYTATGWSLGGGVERKFGAWLLRGEYRYSGLGAVSGILFSGQPVADPGADAVHYSVRVHTHVASFGIAYKF